MKNKMIKKIGKTALAFLFASYLNSSPAIIETRAQTQYQDKNQTKIEGLSPKLNTAEKENPTDSRVIATINMNYELRDILSEAQRGYAKVFDDATKNTIIIDTKTGKSYIEQIITKDEMEKYNKSFMECASLLEFKEEYGNKTVDCLFYAASLAEKQGKEVKKILQYKTDIMENRELPLIFVLGYIARQFNNKEMPDIISVPLVCDEDPNYLFGTKILETKKFDKEINGLEKLLY
jgi:hypothetical protein